MKNKVIIYPSKTSGNITIPTSKSLAHRAIICASLANGISKINNISYSDDIIATIDAMRKIGSNIELINDSLIIKGIDKQFNLWDDEKVITIDVKESASTLRFIIPILTLFNNKFIIKGEKSLFNRPLEIYENIFKRNNLIFKCEDDQLTIKGKIKNNDLSINGNISSQFVSGLLFMLPLQEHDTTLTVNNLESINYVLLTIDVLNKFGIKIDYINNNNDYVFTIKGKQSYNSTTMKIEGDYTQFTNFAVLGSINNDISVSGLVQNSIQGDSIILKELSNITFNNNTLFIKKIDEYQKMIFDITNTPDLGPILAILLLKTGGVIRNCERLKYKESNRLEAIIQELKKFNVDLKLVNNDLFINKLDIINTNLELDSHNDHRIFMALACLATICEKEVVINNYECINKSYPEFLNDLEKINVKFVKL